MKIIFKVLGITIGLLALLIAGLIAILDESLPKGHSNNEADVLAQKMLKVLNYDAYQNTRFLEWSYQAGKNQYKWDKLKGQCTVTWDDYWVNLNLVRPKQSVVKQKDIILNDAAKEKIIEMALANFNNDSFWLVAPYKVFDQGTNRSLVTLEDGEKGLLVTYSSGGTTPGDSYLWKLNADGFPISYKMWVKILPIGGLKGTWDDWIVSESGAFLPKSHKLGPINLSMGNVKGYN